MSAYCIPASCPLACCTHRAAVGDAMRNWSWFDSRTRPRSVRPYAYVTSGCTGGARSGGSGTSPGQVLSRVVCVDMLGMGPPLGGVKRHRGSRVVPCTASKHFAYHAVL